MKNEYKMNSFRMVSNVMHLITGIVIGFVLASQLRTLRYEWKRNLCPFESNSDLRAKINERSDEFTQMVSQIKNRKNPSNLVLIGVMTAQKYIDSRALSIYKTWGKHVPGKIIFFSSSSTVSKFGLPLIPLPTVDDSYPPQKKSFLMLKFMHDHYIDDYDYFMRADDDVYINTRKLEWFLRSINSSKPQLIGQAGVGNKEEFGQLNLGSDENFCMGGPGIVLSNAALRIFSKHIQYCLKHLYSTHEDVEIGRCVRKFVGIPCTWSYDMQRLFHHNTSAENYFDNGQYRVKHLNRAITVHPIKYAKNMHKLHSYININHHRDIRYKMSKIQRSIHEIEQLLNESASFDSHLYDLTFSSSLIRNSVISWEFISRNIYSASNINPKRHIETHLKYAIDNNIHDLMTIINKYSKEKGRIMEFKNLYYGYMRTDPMKGVEYILDLLMVYKKYRGRRITIPVRRHAYAKQTFSNTEIREIESPHDPKNVNIIVPLSGRIEPFKRFIDNFKEVQLIDKYISLAVVLFPDSAHDTQELLKTKRILSDLQSEGMSIKMAQLGGFFSRAAALQRGSTLFPKDSLLLFLDVDMNFSDAVINRVRKNTIQWKQIYFPIVYSQYSPKFIAYESINVTDSGGYWRQFGFGIVALYNSDLQSVGGLNVSIHGWGMEDVNLYDKFVTSNLTIFRCVDPDLIHIYHDIICEPSLTSTQYDMCIGTKFMSLGSVKSLSRYVNINKYLRL